MLLVKESVLVFDREKKHKIGFPTFKLPTSTKNGL